MLAEIRANGRGGGVPSAKGGLSVVRRRVPTRRETAEAPRCVRDARPEGAGAPRWGGGAGRGGRGRRRNGGWLRRGPGAVGNGGIVAYRARSRVRRLGAEHARTAVRGS